MGTRIKIVLLLMLTLTFFKNSFEQNLVKNSSFENFDEIPNGPSNRINVFNVEDWDCPKHNTPDLFTTYKRNRVGIPNNFMGNQLTKSGKAYVGLINYDSNSYGTYKEYVHTKLKESLLKGHLYCVSMYISFTENSEYINPDIGILISKKKLTNGQYQTVKQNDIDHLKDQKFSRDNLITVRMNNLQRMNTISWIKISDIYNAMGGEQYLSIGSFLGNEAVIKSNNIVSKSIGKYGNISYYYIDDVSVVEITNPEECNCQPIEPDPEIIAETEPEPEQITEIVKLDTVQVGQSVVLNNIYFALNDSTLLDSSFTELNKLVKTLSNNPQLKIEIAGHSDNTGITEHNQQLSEARAKAVVSYLVQKGVNNTRLTFKGYGNTKPIANNETEQGRQQNRRVEFLIIEK